MAPPLAVCALSRAKIRSWRNMEVAFSMSYSLAIFSRALMSIRLSSERIKGSIPLTVSLALVSGEMVLASAMIDRTDLLGRALDTGVFATDTGSYRLGVWNQDSAKGLGEGAKKQGIKNRVVKRSV